LLIRARSIDWRDREGNRSSIGPFGRAWTIVPRGLRDQPGAAPEHHDEGNLSFQFPSDLPAGHQLIMHFHKLKKNSS